MKLELQVVGDEYALIDPETGFVTGWHRPVRILTDDGGVDRHDIAFASDPLPVGCIAFVAHEGERQCVERGQPRSRGRSVDRTYDLRGRPSHRLTRGRIVRRTVGLCGGGDMGRCRCLGRAATGGHGRTVGPAAATSSGQYRSRPRPTPVHRRPYRQCGPNPLGLRRHLRHHLRQSFLTQYHYLHCLHC